MKIKTKNIYPKPEMNTTEKKIHNKKKKTANIQKH